MSKTIYIFAGCRFEEFYMPEAGRVATVLMGGHQDIPLLRALCDPELVPPIGFGHRPTDTPTNSPCYVYRRSADGSDIWVSNGEIWVGGSQETYWGPFPPSAEKRGCYDFTWTEERYAEHLKKVEITDGYPNLKKGSCMKLDRLIGPQGDTF